MLSQLPEECTASLPGEFKGLGSDEVHHRHRLLSIHFFSSCLFTPDHVLGQLLSLFGWFLWSREDAFLHQSN